MKNPIEDDSRLVKSVFSEVDNYIHSHSRYPLGQDFYSISIEQKEIKIEDTTLIKV